MIGIIGGSGFVGTRCRSVLERGDHKYINYDIAGEDEETRFLNVSEPIGEDLFAGCSVIINLSAEHRDNVNPTEKYYEVNVTGAENVCAAARVAGVSQIIFVSSVAVYGFVESQTDENGKINFFNSYGESKYLAEEVYKAWYSEDPERRSLVIIRPTVIFGEGNRGNVYNLFRQIADRRFLMFGDGENKKSMAYVGNVAEFICHFIGARAGFSTFNYADGPDMSMNELVTLVRQQLLGKDGVGVRLPAWLGLVAGRLCDVASSTFRVPLPVSSIRVKKFMGSTTFCSATDMGGFVAPYSLRDGLSKTLTYEFDNA